MVDTLRSAAGHLSRAVPLDAWCGFAVDPATLMPTLGYHDEGLPPDRLPRLYELEFGEGDVNTVPALARSRLGAATILGATRGRPESSARYRDVLAPSGLGHELRLALRTGRSTWGAMVLMRSEDLPDFSPAEVRLVASLAGHVAASVRRGLVLSALETAGPDDGPGVVVLGADGALQMCTPAATRWLAEMEDARDTDARVPYLVRAAAHRALVSAARGDGVDGVRARIRVRSGRWLTLHAERLDTGAATTGVAVVIEPSRPSEVARLLLDAYGLTAREREVVQQVLAGRTTAEIADVLVVSPWTVQDHLKKIFAKLDVHSRAEVSATFLHDHR